MNYFEMAVEGARAQAKDAVANRHIDTLVRMVAFKQAKVRRGKEAGKELHYERAEVAALTWAMEKVGSKAPKENGLITNIC